MDTSIKMATVSKMTMTVCPALHISLSSELWSMVGDEGGEKSLINLRAEKTKTVYLLGENLNVDDLQVTACYTHPVSGNTEVLLTEGYTINAAEIDMNTAGNKTLRISYTENGEQNLNMEKLQHKICHSE